MLGKLLLQVADASEYGGILLDGGITLGISQRRAMIWSAITDVARYFGGYVPDACQEDLLPEVANLVEAPTIVAGSFSSSFLSIPGCGCCRCACGCRARLQLMADSLTPSALLLQVATRIQ